MKLRRRVAPSVLGFQIAPMVDILLVLLCFFIVTWSFARKEMELDVKVPTAENAKESNPVVNQTVINVKADLKKRMKGWKPPKPNYTWGVLAKYAATVSSASEGAVTIPIGLVNGGTNGHQDVLGKRRKAQSARR